MIDLGMGLRGKQEHSDKTGNQEDRLHLMDKGNLSPSVAGLKIQKRGNY